ncbi:MAG TPA: DUF4279 domain-containing protein [Gemmatimonadaceae bacterium]|nr:DUF4279 domain-containing protein [Gemmatimonadaceae bacterium]
MGLNPLHEDHIRGVAVTFSVSAPDLDPDAVSAVTGLQPDDSARRGDVRRNRAGTPRRPEVEGWWALGTRGKLATKDVREHFRYLHERLLPHAETFREFGRGGETFFDVFWQSTYLYAGTGPLLDAADLAGVAALGAGMGFDIYQVDEEVEGESAVPKA